MGARTGTDNQINKPVCLLAGRHQGNEIKKPVFKTGSKSRRLDPFLLDAGGGQPGEGLKDTFGLFFMPQPAIEKRNNLKWSQSDTLASISAANRLLTN